MGDFEELRVGLTNARKEAAKARQKLTSIRQNRRRLQTQLTEARRVRPERASSSLSAQLAAANNEERQQQARVETAESLVRQRANDFATVADPRSAITTWSAATPILLFPVRLETRFMSRGAKDELWIRIYPDDCLIDTFEPTLSDTEYESARRYWIETWAAGGIEAQRRAAWRNLVAAHGSGRAAWIIQKAKPADSGPPKDRPEDVLLIITADAPQSPKVQETLGEYWKAVWLADGDKTKIDAAASSLAGTSGIAAPESLISRFAPANLASRPAPPHSKREVKVDVAWLILQSPDTLKARSWSEPPRAQLMPDCFVVLGYQNGTLVFEARGRPIPSPLIAGPDPSAPEADQMQFGTDGHLNVPEDMAWMTDFESAIEVGMAIKVPLDGERVDLSRPIDRVIALGLRLADGAESGSAHLEQLITKHRYARPGLAFVPQGTPTNNTDSDSAGFSRTDDADASYDALFDPKAEITPSSNWWHRQDGEWLADALGIDWHTLNRVPQSSNADFSEARAMNRALWPATLGYTMETMLNPIFDSGTIETTRWFYTHYVTGRGFLPCLRVGNQPYGVLPISALSRWTWPSGEDGASDGLLGYSRGLHSTLAAMRADWAVWAQASASIGKAGDAHQVLLDILGLNATSMEYYQRYAESFDHLFNLAKFEGIAGQMLAATGLSLQQQAMLLLRRLGYTGGAEPDALQRFFFDAAQRLNGPFIDDRPLAERDPIRAYTDDGHNYIEWLINTARSSFDDLRLERGFSENKAPLALLYTMLRHALQLGYWDSALKLHQAAGLLTDEATLRARREPVAIHLAQASGASESRLATLYSTDARITGANDVTVAQHITQSIAGEPTVQALNALNEQLSALTMLKDLPTARLERCLAEHIDTASYRLDAWLLGLVNFQLMSLRYGPPAISPGSGTLSSVGGRSASSSKTQLPGDERRATKRGVYLGTYGILENLQRAKAPLKQAELAGSLQKKFSDMLPLLNDPSSGGYIFAPSLSQATTAAILRAGYLSNASAQRPDALAVNLSSQRVRDALGMIEGIRNGQPLGALLGYQLERGLHENDQGLKLDKFVDALRQRFPLVANQLASTKIEGVAIDTIEANNVLDGMKLTEHIRLTGNSSYPYGLRLAYTANDAERNAIDMQVGRLLDAYDAIADLAIAEGVHEAVLGNYDRVSATLEAYSKGTFPPEPEVVRTPRSGLTLTHRVSIHFDPSSASPVSPLQSPRAWAQPMINAWLASVLPDPHDVACLVVWTASLPPYTQHPVPVSQFDLGLQPIDLLYIANPDGAQAMTELDDRIVRYAIGHLNIPGDAVINLQHSVRTGGTTFFELSALLRHLRSALLRSRALVPADLMPAGSSSSTNPNLSQSIDPRRVTRIRDALHDLGQRVEAFDPATGDVDTVIDRAVELFEQAARFGLGQTGWGFLYEWRRRTYAELLANVRAVVARWNDRLSQFNQRFQDYTNRQAQMSEDERKAALARLDLLIAAMPLSPRPPDASQYENKLNSHLQNFESKLSKMESLLSTTDPKLAALLQAVKTELPLTSFDNTSFSVADIEHDIDVFRTNLSERMKALKAAIDKRLADAVRSLAASDQASDPLTRLDSLGQAASALLGDSVKLIPEFELTPSQQSELADAYAVSKSGALLNFLRSTKQIEDPVDDWLHGVARVREKLFAWEQMTVLAAILSDAQLPLTPLQLPHRSGESWLALEFDAAKKPDGERLLYTAYFSTELDTSSPLCGLLLDEWTEVLPASKETAGLVFHYNRPSSEPPQCWLLVTPALGSGDSWQWPDVTGAVDEALSLGRLRAVEPADMTTYARFLPATVSAVMLYGISIAANYARINNVMAQMTERAGD